MAYCGYITRLKNVRRHSGADRLLLAECFGNQVIVSTDYTEGQLGVYFPSDGQLCQEYCEINNLLRKKDENGNNIGGYMDERRRVTAVKLRGEKSDGLFMPLTSLANFTTVSDIVISLLSDNLGKIFLIISVGAVPPEISLPINSPPTFPTHTTIV